MKPDLFGLELAITPWRIKKIVLPQHTDHSGVMWHGSYIAWLEEARIDALLKAGLLYKEISDNGIEMPVISLKINYLKTLHHGDKVVLESFALPRKGVRWPWKTSFLKEGIELVAEANVELVVVNQNGPKPRLIRRVPDQIQRTLMQLQYGPGNINKENS